MNLEPVIARIDTACPLFKLVDGVAEFAVLDGKPKATPACYVVPLSERDDGADDMDAEDQQIAASFGLIIAVSNVSTPGGRAALADLQTLRKSARSALLGWVPDGCDMSVLFDRGSLIAIQSGVVWWQDAFRTAYSTIDQ